MATADVTARRPARRRTTRRRAAREATLAPPTRRGQARRRRASSTSASGSRCCSTTASFVEDGQLANALAAGLPADGVVTGRGRSTAGRRSSSPTTRPSRPARGARARSRRSSGPPRRRCARSCRSSGSIDSAGARITDQVELFPGRRGAGRIFHNQVALSGKVPQICCLFGPSAAGGAYIPAFCDIVIMVEGNASMYLGSPRMAEMVVGEKVTLEEMGGARMHCTVSGCGDNLAVDDADAIEQARLYFSYLPTCWREHAADVRRRGAGARRSTRRRRARADESVPFDMHDGHRRAGRRRLVLRGQAAVRGRAGHRLRPARRASRSASSPTTRRSRAACCSPTRADKAARFIWLCDAFNMPLRLPGRRARLHDRLARSSGRASSGTAPR